VATLWGMTRMTRRDFLRAAMALTVTTACGGSERPRGGGGGGGLARRRLGNTGVTVSLVGLGGYHMGTQATEEESIRIVRTAIDGGIDFMDNCWDYNDGESERRMGKALRDGYRERVFLMTKVDGRDRESAARQLEESLSRLGTDHIDLVQMHEVIRESDPERILEEGGALEALAEARQAGKVRFLGFTGHKSPRWHLAMLDRSARAGVTWDTVQMPLNVLDAHFDSFERQVLPRLVQDGVGVIGMKPMADGRIVYEGIASAEECLRYAMSLPVGVTLTGCDSLERVEQALRVARDFTPLSEDEVNALLDRTAEAAQAGASERYKTTEEYDGTTQNPEWLG